MSVQENWRPVVGWEGVYEVSDLGRVRSLPRSVAVTWHDGTVRVRNFGVKIMKPWKRTKYGHVSVRLRLHGKGNEVRQVHALVMEAFVGPRADSVDVCHGNGDPEDNRLANLRYDTPQSNAFDMVSHGRGNASLTHCVNGHEFTPENTYVTIRSTNGRPRRQCRACRSERAVVRALREAT